MDDRDEALTWAELIEAARHLASALSGVHPDDVTRVARDTYDEAQAVVAAYYEQRVGKPGWFQDFMRRATENE